MSEEFIMQYIPERLKQLGYTKYHIRYRDMVVYSGYALVIPAYNELYFIVGDPAQIIVESDYGIYDSWTFPLENNEHQHRGEIVITNRTPDYKRIKFIQVIMVN